MLFRWLFLRSRDNGGWHECHPPRLPKRTVDGDWISQSLQTWRRRRDDGQWEYKQDGQWKYKRDGTTENGESSSLKSPALGPHWGAGSCNEISDDRDLHRHQQAGCGPTT
jgi:hypothetical protein